MNYGQENYVRSPENPNGLFEIVTDPTFIEQVPQFERRLAIATADIQIYVTDVLGIEDKQMASQVAMRAAQEILATVGVTLEPETQQVVFMEAERLANPE